ncbi:hypothetical protein PIB30_037017 [Stylosanthes scabra]|uniref:Uncharacterized protein n=1 Tax=Stylosanthes scabra TaxID=79078 RepID=A0ABU6RDM8_9FABA|nr:hypothetical protein [Stylosanthes scabra]
MGEQLERQERAVVTAEDEEKEGLLDGMAVLDFDMLCSSVALRTAQRNWGKLGRVVGDHDDHDEENGGEFGGVLRMWEGELLDCFDDRRILLESTCLPCYRFGKNMKRAGFGSCYGQATMYFLLAFAAFLNFIAFAITKRHCFLYLAVAFIFSIGSYLGFFRSRIRQKFNIKGSDSSLDDCIYHFACPCCTLSQESRTLEMNNVQDGTWHGRGDTVCIEGFGGKGMLNPPPVVTIESAADKSSMEKSIDLCNTA